MRENYPIRVWKQGRIGRALGEGIEAREGSNGRERERESHIKAKQISTVFVFQSVFR